MSRNTFDKLLAFLIVFVQIIRRLYFSAVDELFWFTCVYAEKPQLSPAALSAVIAGPVVAVVALIVVLIAVIKLASRI